MIEVPIVHVADMMEDCMLTVGCPTCKAEKGQPCHTLKTDKIRIAHVKRQNLHLYFFGTPEVTPYE